MQVTKFSFEVCLSPFPLFSTASSVSMALGSVCRSILQSSVWYWDVIDLFEQHHLLSTISSFLPALYALCNAGDEFLVQESDLCPVPFLG